MFSVDGSKHSRLGWGVWETLFSGLHLKDICDCWNSFTIAAVWKWDFENKAESDWNSKPRSADWSVGGHDVNSRWRLPNWTTNMIFDWQIIDWSDFCLPEALADRSECRSDTVSMHCERSMEVWNQGDCPSQISYFEIDVRCIERSISRAWHPSICPNSR
jgi:hypothetical protein